MKKISVLLLILHFFILKSQDSLSVINLTSLTHYFQIGSNKQMSGEGADFLRKEFKTAQFVLLGEYHNSKRISEFTNSIIPILNENNFKTMLLEVGPISGNYLNNLNGTIKDSLFLLNSNYKISIGNRVYTPIPFFENISDAEFLTTSKMYNWNILGIDQEFNSGIPFLTDLLYKNLNRKEKKQYVSLYNSVKDSISQFVEIQNLEDIRLTVQLENAPIYNEFLLKMNEFSKNKPIVQAIKSTLRIYNLNAEKKWFLNNKLRVEYMKNQLNTQLNQLEFDLKNDKIFAKMGGRHLSKGMSPGRLYEVGNTLNELAEFNGNKTVNFSFVTRFYKDDEVEKDVLDSNNKYYHNLKSLIQMGKKEEWTLIDLRPLIEGYYYYPKKYLLNEAILDLARRYDFLIIPKIEIEPVKNYK